jgi:hypothetical protein
LTWPWSLRVAGACLVIPPALRLLPLDRLVERLGRQRSPRRPDAVQQQAIMERVDALLGRLPPPWRKTCLTRSVVLYHLLRRSGVPVELCIGVRRDDQEFAAHAWLEREGRPYMELGEVTGYEELARFA